jgi:thymidylate synthase (FAD)
MYIKDGRKDRMSEARPSVKLVAYTPNPEHVIAEMARLCYADDARVARLFNSPLDLVDDARMINGIVKMKHLSPLEHANWTFLIEGVSRALTHQLVRHRHLAISQRSQRYVEQKNFDYIVPHTVKQAGLEERYRHMMTEIGEFYEELGKGLEKMGLSGELKNQDARYVLPNSCETKIGITSNGRELLHIFQERLCNRAQWEIRYLSEEMLKLAYPTAPAIFSHAGPSCYSDGKCYQGKKTCGKMQEVIEHFSKYKN